MLEYACEERRGEDRGEEGRREGEEREGKEKEGKGMGRREESCSASRVILVQLRLRILRSREANLPSVPCLNC